MKRVSYASAALVGLLLLMLVPSLAQTGFPPLPVDLRRGMVLFPDVIVTGEITAQGQSPLYVLLAHAGEDLRVRLHRTSGAFVPYLELRADADADPLRSVPATDLAGRTSELRFTVQADGWYFITTGNDPANGELLTGEYELLLTGTTVDIFQILGEQTLDPAFNGVLGDFVTLTPTYTSTPTYTPTATHTPTNTPTFTPTHTFTPTIDPNQCNGLTPLRAVGQTVVVDFNQQGPNSALRLIVDLYALRSVTAAQAYNDQQMQIVDGPVCFAGERWFWQVYLPTSNIYGWVPETDTSGDPFLCPLAQPECRRFGGG